MSTIEVITSEREPGQVQVFATEVDAAVASLGGISQATLWLPTDLAGRPRRDLLERLGDTPAVQRVPPDPTWTRKPTCWPWCAGATDPHGPAECYAEHSFITLTLGPRLQSETRGGRRRSTSTSRSTTAQPLSGSRSVRTPGSTAS
jgi:hypothetical protein